MSKIGASRWTGRLQDIVTARVLGMLHWAAKDGDPVYQGRYKTAFWEVPLIEVVLKEAL